MIITGPYTLFAGGDTPEHIVAAKEYIKKHNLTKEQVKLAITDSAVFVKVRAGIQIEWETKDGEK